MKNKNNILNKYNIAWFRKLCKEKESFESVIIGSAVLWELLDIAESEKEQFTALRHGLAISLLFNVVLLAVVLVTISGW